MSITSSTHRSPIAAKGPAMNRMHRGMTLVEVMIVVVIVGVLSALGIYGVTRYIRSAQASEAYGVINAIRGAQDIYRQDTMKYLDVSQGSFSNTHPAGTPGAFKTAWAGGSSTAATRFRQLGVEVDSATYFTFACVAVDPGNGVPSPPTSKQNFGFPSQVSEPVYVIVAKANIDGDSTFSYMLTHSLTNEVYVENEGE
jgi:prepilin-type N-terminal cleavage/methylation domain-containing protein